MKNRKIIIVFIVAFFCLYIQGKAQSKCDSIFTIKVYDSSSHKPLKSVWIHLHYGGRYSRAGKTNRKGIVKFILPIKLDFKNKVYLFKASLFGWEIKRDIQLMLDCNCEQKVYIVRWAKDKKLER